MEKPISAELRTLNAELFDYIMIHHPSLIFSPRQTNDSKTKRGIAFLTGNKNTSEYIAIPLLKKGAARGKSISFVIHFNKKGVFENAIEIYFDSRFDEEDELIHNKIINELKLSSTNQDFPQSLKMISYTNSCKFLYKKPDKYLDNLEDFIKNKSKIIEEVVKSFGDKKIKEYSIDQAEFLKKINNIKDKMNMPINELENQENERKEVNVNIQNVNLNQILFGPPGTGKTYNSINKTLELLNENVSGKSRKQIKELYEQKVNEGQIVFTTFHQNMSYEDFIEGIKPSLDYSDSSENIGYEIVPGIFKALCTKAKGSDYKGAEEAYDKLIEELNSYPEDKFLDLVTSNGKAFSVKANSRNSVSLYTGPEKRKSGSLTKVGVLRQLSGESYYKWWISYYEALIQLLKNKYGLSNVSAKITKPYVLIIDEINRGNVSQIFGELITLIEEDKRLGKEEALEVTLPYSKEKFGVPPNVFIIGTMNTADRSVEALDTALRRRFDFIEMPPKPEVITIEGKLKEQNGILHGIDLPVLLSTINSRIELLLDKDHLIGHSYFMNVANLQDLKSAFQNKIIPLLQEYFYGDYGKIGLVLGNDFFESAKTEATIKFASFDYPEGDVFSDRIIYKLKNIARMDDTTFIYAILNMMN